VSNMKDWDLEENEQRKFNLIFFGKIRKTF